MIEGQKLSYRSTLCEMMKTILEQQFQVIVVFKLIIDSINFMSRLLVHT